MKLSSVDLEKIARYENKRGIEYAKTGGKLYNGFLIVGFLAWLYMMMMSLLYILGTFLGISSGTNSWDNDFITVLCAFAVIFFSVLIYAFKLKLPAFFANIAAIPVMAIGFINKTKVGNYSSGSDVSEYDPGFLGLKKIFFWRHGIPMLIVFVVCIVLAVIVLRERTIRKKEFNKISENEYKSQIVSDDE